MSLSTKSLSPAVSPEMPDDNGKVNLKDINRIIRHLAGWDVEINLGNADYDGNGKVDLMT